MAAWGAGSFDNDDASDWLSEFADNRRLETIEDTLATVAALGNNEYLEAPEASVAIAAAEVVSALRTRASMDLPAEVADWASRHTSLGTRELSDLALKALERVRTNSELRELWDKTDSKPWLNNILDLEERLQM